MSGVECVTTPGARILPGGSFTSDHHRVLVLVPRIGGFEQIRLRIDGQHDVDDVLHGDVVQMRAVPAAPAQVITNAIFGDPNEGVIQRFDAHHAVPLVRVETHRDADAVPQRRQPRIVDLQLKAGGRDHLVFGLERVGEREHELVLRAVVLVRSTDFDAGRRGGRQKRVGDRKSIERVAQRVDLALKRLLADVLNRSAAQERHATRRHLIGYGARLLEQRAARECLAVKVGELRPVLAGHQGRAHGGCVRRLEA